MDQTMRMDKTLEHQDETASCSGSSSSPSGENCGSRACCCHLDIFLSAEERYEVWEVKSAERPHLLVQVPMEPQLEEEKQSNSACDSVHRDDSSQPTTRDQKEEESDDKGGASDSSSLGTPTSDSNISSSCSSEIPLIDGCDIPGWRHRGLVHVSPYLQGVLNVGVGCPLTRRLSQIPIVSTRASQAWQVLQNKLLRPPHPTIGVVSVV
jgi:hypothetical protein